MQSDNVIPLPLPAETRNTFPGQAGFCQTFFLSVFFFLVSPDIFAETVASPQESKLANRAMPVTGAGSGMGERIALLSGEEKAKVAAVDIDRASARKTADAITVAKGDASAITTDKIKEKTCRIRSIRP